MRGNRTAILLCLGCWFGAGTPLLAPPVALAQTGAATPDSRFPHLAEQLNLDVLTAERLAGALLAASTPDPAVRERQLDAVALGTYQPPTSQALAAELGAERRAIRRVLGDASFGRFLDYTSTLGTRRSIAALEQRLAGAGIALGREQRERLIKLLDVAGRRQELEASLELPDARTERFPGVSAAQARQLRRARVYELVLLRQQRYSAQRVLAAARVLTPEQHAVFSALEAASLDSWRGRMRAARDSAGLDLDAAIMPEQTAFEPVAAQLAWAVTVTVNGTARRATFASASGDTATFEAPAGLTIAATPFVYGTRLAVVLEVYEKLIDGPHLIDVSYDVVPLASRLDLQQPPYSTPLERVIAGSDGHVLRAQVAGAIL